MAALKRLGPSSTAGVAGGCIAELPRKVLHLFLATDPNECASLKQQLQGQLERKKPPKVSVPAAISPPTAMAKVVGGAGDATSDGPVR